MPFQSTQFSRSAVALVDAPIERVFPLLCPKKEEDWIPGWQCETLWSRSGCNEDGAIFRTSKPYGTELYWHTLQFNIDRRIVDFLITAPRLFHFRFTITVEMKKTAQAAIHFHQTFTSVSEEGREFLERYQSEDFAARVQTLGALMTQYLNARKP